MSEAGERYREGVPTPLVDRLRLHAGEPVSDALRDEISGRLNDAYVAGALDEGAYRNLLGLLFDAATLGDLVPVAESLPRTPTYAEPAIVRSSEPGVLATTGPGTIQPVPTDSRDVVRRGRAAAWTVVGLGAVVVVLVVLALLLAL